MTLSDFFQRLIDKTRAASIPMEYWSGSDSAVKSDPEAVLVSHLQSLKRTSEVSPDSWRYHRSTTKSSWLTVLEYNRKYNLDLFAEFQGNAELREALKAFLSA